jgi:PTS system nitrogen regulatory IIA component
MDIEDFLSPADAMIDVPAFDKTRMLNDLSVRAARALKLDRNTIAGEILKREELGSTGIGKGVAIPHARISGVRKPFGILVRLKRSIEFDSIDGELVDLVFLLLLPQTERGEQLNALAAVARKLRDKKTLHDLRSATDNDTLFSALLG